MEQGRIDKLLSREFLVGILGAILLTFGYFLRETVEFSDYAFWLTIALGIPAGALTVQKAAGGLSRSKE